MPIFRICIKALRPSRAAHPQSLLLGNRASKFSTSVASRLASTEPPPEDAEEPTDEESSVLHKLKQRFQGGEIAVQDVSGGCGSFYAISIRHNDFKGLTTIKSHRMVNQLLQEELTKWHGVQLKTMSTDS